MCVCVCVCVYVCVGGGVGGGPFLSPRTAQNRQSARARRRQRVSRPAAACRCGCGAVRTQCRGRRRGMGSCGFRRTCRSGLRAPPRRRRGHEECQRPQRCVRGISPYLAISPHFSRPAVPVRGRSSVRVTYVHITRNSEPFGAKYSLFEPQLPVMNINCEDKIGITVVCN